MSEPMQCPVITRKGKPCSVGGEASRNGYCHIHDPDGNYMKTRPRFKARGFMDYPMDEYELHVKMIWDGKA